MATLSRNQEAKDMKKTLVPKSTGNFIRKAVLISALALATPAFLNAQAKQIFFPSDSTSAAKLISSLYSAKKKQANQTPATLEFIGGFEAYIEQYPKNALKLTDDFSLTIEDQKSLRREPWLETDTHVLLYIFEIKGNYLGSLYVFKKKK